MGPPTYEETMDYLGIACHGMGVTHIDALCHTAVRGQMYNGADIRLVKSTGAARNGLGAATSGLAGRGVLIDLPGARDADWIDPPAVLGPADLDAAVAAQGVEIQAGDILFVSTGRDARRAAQGMWNPFSPGLVGMGPECIPWLAERDLALLGTDGISDPLPPHDDTEWPFPIHQTLISGMGIHLIDNLALAELTAACRREGRWAFFVSVLPLRLPRATGCPVNPIAIL
jgi:kynurenine formamidase